MQVCLCAVLLQPSTAKLPVPLRLGNANLTHDESGKWSIWKHTLLVRCCGTSRRCAMAHPRMSETTSISSRLFHPNDSANGRAKSKAAARKFELHEVG